MKNMNSSVCEAKSNVKLSSLNYIYINLNLDHSNLKTWVFLSVVFSFKLKSLKKKYVGI